MEGNTWFMSSLNDTREENEAEYLYFPLQASKGRLDKADGTKNSYALAWPKTLPNSLTLSKGLTFVSDTYYDYKNLWHGLCAVAPFVGWSIKNGRLMPDRWHNLGSMGKARKLDSLRCKARRFCGLNPVGKGLEVNERGKPIISLTLLMRGSRSFKNPTAVIQISRVEGCILNVSQSEDLRFCDHIQFLRTLIKLP
ncbi:hypothetical protein Q3G72_025984 [Acer saccharum]|nr:hypothetical protein Q3G72_025984 [Acer saccharum]